MAIGLGQMLIGGLLGNEIGKKGGIGGLLGGLTGDNKGRVTDEEMATHQMPDGTTMPGASHPQQQAQAPQQQGGGFMDGISNMMGNPSDSKIARMGLAFNSMRMHPDDNLAKSFQTRIDASTTTKGIANGVKALRKMGKNNVANLLEGGSLTLNEAMKYALDDKQTTDIKASLNLLRADPTNLQLLDLADMVEADNTMHDEAMKAYMKIKGLSPDSKYAKQFSQVFTDESNGQQYKMVSDATTGETVRQDIEGAFAETLAQKALREKEQKFLQKDEEKATLYGTKAYEDSRVLRDQIGLFESALEQIDDGALSGWLQTKLPSMDERTSLLRGIQNKLGISVINSATFGALSEREMHMAMKTNLDLDLPPAELRQMVLEQIRARRKLAQEFERQSEMLLVEGNGTWSSFVTSMLEETKKNDAVVWDELRPAEVETLLAEGIDRNAYMDLTYTQRRKIFDLRK